MKTVKESSQRGRGRAVLLVVVMATLASVHCGSVGDISPDSAGMTVDAPAMNADARPRRRPSVHVSTSGGGLAASVNYRSQISIGAPQPMGQTASTGFKAALGPQAK